MPTLPDNTPNFPLTEGFVLPPLEAEDMQIVSTVIDTSRYVAVPMYGARENERVFGSAHPDIRLDQYACAGFAAFTLMQMEERVGVRGILAPPARVSQIRQLIDYKTENLRLAHQGPIGLPPIVEEIQAALHDAEAPVATGVFTNIHPKDPSRTFNSLIVPRTFIDTFGVRHSEGAATQYGTKLSSLLFARFSGVWIDRLNDQDSPHRTPDV